MKSSSKNFGLLVGALLCAASLSLAAQTQPAQAAAPKAKKPAKQVKQIDINKASKAELMKLPQISADLADKIIAGRPYLSKTNLVTHNVIPMVTYQAIRTRIFVIATLPAKK
jgi:DNA uptake protein ComE-like DNA-binding protein